MKVHAVQVFFKKLAKCQVKYRFLFLLILGLISVIGITGIDKVEILSDEKNIVSHTEEHEQKVKEFEQLFGNTETIVLLVESKDVFQKEVLKTIKEIGKELMDKVPASQSVMSITDIDITIANDDELTIIHPFQDGIPDDEQEIEKLRCLILSKKNVVGKLVSKDCTECWIILSLNPFDENTESGAGRVLTPMYKAGQAAIDIVTDKKWKSDKYTIKAAGTPYTEMEERVVIKDETTRTVMISFSVMVILLITFTMSFIGTVIPIIALVLGIGVVFGFMGHFGVVADSNMVSIPILLAMALSVGYSIHLINSFKNHFYILGRRKEAVIASIEETGSPLLFTVITTMASVLSFLTTSLYPLRWLGGACGATVFSVYLYAAILIPIIMSFGKDKDASELSKKKEARIFNFVDNQFVRFARFVIKMRLPILIVSILLFAICIPSILSIKIKMDAHTFMGPEIPHIKRMDDIATSKLGSYFNYSAMLSFDNFDALKSPDTLKKIEELEKFISQFKYTKWVDGEPKIFSFLDIVKELNQTMHADDPAYYKIPDSREELSQMLLVYESQDGKVSNWVDDEYRTAKIRIEVSMFDSEELTSNMEALKQKAGELLPEVHIFLVGADVDFANINSYIVSGELSSLLFSLIAIFVLMWIVFGSFRLALIGMIPNVAPLLAIGAVMGYFGIYLDMITMTIIPLLLGISVDDTIYFITHAKMEFEKEKDYKMSIEKTFYSIGKTLLATSIILCIGFATNSVSHLAGIVKIGLLGAFGFFVALVADYFLSPVLIFMFKPFRMAKR